MFDRTILVFTTWARQERVDEAVNAWSEALRRGASGNSATRGAAGGHLACA